jgi:hypothetical protein
MGDGLSVCEFDHDLKMGVSRLAGRTDVMRWVGFRAVKSRSCGVKYVEAEIGASAK